MIKKTLKYLIPIFALIIIAVLIFMTNSYFIKSNKDLSKFLTYDISNSEIIEISVKESDFRSEDVKHTTDICVIIKGKPDKALKNTNSYTKNISTAEQIRDAEKIFTNCATDHPNIDFPEFDKIIQSGEMYNEDVYYAFDGFWLSEFASPYVINWFSYDLDGINYLCFEASVSRKLISLIK